MLIITVTLLLFTGAAVGSLSVSPVCTFNQNAPCYAALGRPLQLQLFSAFDVILKKGHDTTPPDCILRFRNNTETLHGLYQPRWSFTARNSTMMIRSVERKDSGRYFLENYDLKGKDKGIYFLQLITEAVVSSVEVMDSCFFSQKRRVNCSSDGDQIQFSWTLSGTTFGSTLTDGNQTLLLDKDFTGNVTCYVENHVSREHITTELQKCPGLVTVIPACTLNQNGPCYGVVGRPLYLQLDSEKYELSLKKSSNESHSKDLIFRFKDQKIKQNHPDPRWQFFTENRTMLISRAEKEDSGEYRLDTYDSSGKGKIYHFHLIIEAVVSSVEVTDSCLFSEKRRVICWSDGDQIWIRWSLSGIKFGYELTDGNRTLLLDKADAGNVTCRVENSISRAKITAEIHPCPAVMLLFVGVLEILLLVALLSGFFIYIRIQKIRSSRSEREKLEVEEHQSDTSDEDETGSIVGEEA